jgi:hypothetical protein
MTWRLKMLQRPPFTKKWRKVSPSMRAPGQGATAARVRIYRGSNDDAIATVDADDATPTYCFVLDYRIRDPFTYFILFGFYGWTDRVGVV